MLKHAAIIGDAVRLRFCLSSLKGRDSLTKERAEEIRESLVRLSEVHSVEVKTLTGSIIIHCNAQKQLVAYICQILESENTFCVGTTKELVIHTTHMPSGLREKAAWFALEVIAFYVAEKYFGRIIGAISIPAVKEIQAFLIRSKGL